MGEVPAILGAGFHQLREGRFLLCSVEKADLVRQWLKRVLSSGLVKSLGDVRRAGDETAPVSLVQYQAKMPALEAVTIGVSHAGLMALGLKDDRTRPFPSAFRAGMGHPLRRRLIGDEPAAGAGSDELENWVWSDTGGSQGAPVHLLVAHYWHDDAAPHALLAPAEMQRHGMSVCAVAVDPRAIRRSTDARLTMHEPFGFRDGVGQPQLRGLVRPLSAYGNRADRPLRYGEANLVEPGEFILGHRNEYGEPSYSPSVQGWSAQSGGPEHFGTHGSYLAVRQIRQDVVAFKRYVDASMVERLASKMIGRRMNGWPLPTGPHSAASPNDFMYLASDEPGFDCPRGAHVRRAHVRDALAHDETEGIQSSRLHRLLRRGRVYVDDLAKSSTGDGLMFLALNADLDRQFEFVHRNWIMGSRFGDLSDEQDPILGTRPDRMFTVPGCPVGQRVGPLPRFTWVLGGGYFLVPGMSALRFMAESS